MGCLTQASQYELALYAHSKGKLLINPWYQEGPANTLSWQKANNWYTSKTTRKFWTSKYWAERDDLKSFVIKSLESRFNFVFAVQTHGTDLMIMDNDFNKSINELPFSRAVLLTKFDIDTYDSHFAAFVKTVNKSDLTEPKMEDYRL